MLFKLACAAALCGHAVAVVRTPTPFMGWNSYNYYGCSPNEALIKDNAKGLVDLGFAEKGYTFVTPDCGWVSANRTADGQITWNAALFPSGFPALGDYIHGLGLKFGVYSGAGVYQCGSTDLQASLGYEMQDAQTFASWGADSLKYDNCWATAAEDVDYDAPEKDLIMRFAAMSNALDAVNRSIVYQICEWGVGEDLGVWAPTYGDSWRISNDIQNNWQSIWRIVNQVVPYWKHTGVGKYADMDMLTVGLKVLSLEEERFHFTMWAINKSPLVIGAPMNTSITPQESLDILANDDVLAINQDALGEQARLIRRYTEEQYDVWAGNLSDSRMVVAIPNWSNDSQTVEIDLDSLGIAAAGQVRDVWAATDMGLINAPFSVSLIGHEAKLLVLSDTQPSNQTKVEISYSPATQGTLSGEATSVSCTSGQCLPVGSKIGNLYTGSSITFHNVSGGVPSATDDTSRLIGVDYINYDVALESAWTNGTNTRNLTLSVNGGTPKRWAFPISGGDWYETGRLNIVLDGFMPQGNEIKVEAPGPDPGPDVVGLAVYN